MFHKNGMRVRRYVLHCKGYVRYGGKCPQCGSTNTYVDQASGIHWCGNCDCEW